MMREQYLFARAQKVLYLGLLATIMTERDDDPNDAAREPLEHTTETAEQYDGDKKFDVEYWREEAIDER